MALPFSLAQQLLLAGAVECLDEIFFDNEMAEESFAVWRETVFAHGISITTTLKAPIHYREVALDLVKRKVLPVEQLPLEELLEKVSYYCPWSGMTKYLPWSTAVIASMQKCCVVLGGELMKQSHFTYPFLYDYLVAVANKDMLRYLPHGLTEENFSLQFLWSCLQHDEQFIRLTKGRSMLLAQKFCSAAETLLYSYRHGRGWQTTELCNDFCNGQHDNTAIVAGSRWRSTLPNNQPLGANQLAMLPGPEANIRAYIEFNLLPPQLSPGEIQKLCALKLGQSVDVHLPMLYFSDQWLEILAEYVETSGQKLEMPNSRFYPNLPPRRTLIARASSLHELILRCYHPSKDREEYLTVLAAFLDPCSVPLERALEFRSSWELLLLAGVPGLAKALPSPASVIKFPLLLAQVPELPELIRVMMENCRVAKLSELQASFAALDELENFPGKVQMLRNLQLLQLMVDAAAFSHRLHLLA